jgi:hypothetical protein
LRDADGADPVVADGDEARIGCFGRRDTQPAEESAGDQRRDKGDPRAAEQAGLSEGAPSTRPTRH